VLPRREQNQRRTIRLPSIHSIATLDLMTHSTADPDMQMLMAAVGEVLLTWGYVESAILDRLAALEGIPTKAPKTSPVSRWKNAESPTPEIAEVLAEIERLAEVRNCLAHGLEAASVDPDDEHAPAVICRTQAGKRHISFSTMVDTQRRLHRLSHAIRALPTADLLIEAHF